METCEVPKLELLWRELVLADRALRVVVMAVYGFTRVRRFVTRRIDPLSRLERVGDVVLERVGRRAQYNLALRNFVETFGEQIGFPCEIVERIQPIDPRFTVPRTWKIKSRKQLIRFVKRMLFLGRRIIVLPDVKGKTKVMWV